MDICEEKKGTGVGGYIINSLNDLASDFHVHRGFAARSSR